MIYQQKPELESATALDSTNGNSTLEPKTIPPENGIMVETQDKGVVMEGLGSVGIYDQWVPPAVSGNRPKPRYEVLHTSFWLVLDFVHLIFSMNRSQ